MLCRCMAQIYVFYKYEICGYFVWCCFPWCLLSLCNLLLLLLVVDLHFELYLVTLRLSTLHKRKMRVNVRVDTIHLYVCKTAKKKWLLCWHEWWSWYLRMIFDLKITGKDKKWAKKGLHQNRYNLFFYFSTCTSIVFYLLFVRGLLHNYTINARRFTTLTNALVKSKTYYMQLWPTYSKNKNPDRYRDVVKLKLPRWLLPIICMF